jgi:hypothetical protein
MTDGEQEPEQAHRQSRAQGNREPVREKNNPPLVPADRA